MTLAESSRQASQGQEAWAETQRMRRRSFIDRGIGREGSRWVLEGASLLANVLGAESVKQ